MNIKYDYLMSFLDTNNTSLNKCSSEINFQVDPAVACARAICGDEDITENYSEMLERANSSTLDIDDPDLNTKIDQLLSESLQNDVNKALLIAPKINQFINGPENLSDALKKMTYATHLFTYPLKVIFERYDPIAKEGETDEQASKQNNIIDATERNGRYEISINYNQLFDLINNDDKLSLNEKKLINQTAQSNMLKVFIYEFLGLPLPSIIAEISPDQTFEQALSEVTKTLPQSFDDFISSMDFEWLDQYEINRIKREWGVDNIEKLKDGVFPDYEALKEMYLAYIFVQEINQLFKNELFLNEYLNFDAKKNMVDKYDKPMTFTSDFDYINQNEDMVKQKIKLTKDKCLADIAFTLNTLPNNTALKQFAKEVQETKNQFTQKIFNRFSATSAKHLTEEIKNLDIIPPKSKDKFKQELIDNLIQKVKQDKNDISTIQAHNSKLQHLIYNKLQDGFTLVDYVYDMNTGEYTDEKLWISSTIFDETREMCEYNKPDTLNDAFWPLKVGAIQASWNTIKSKRFGKGVLAHELGHAISPYFKDQSLSKHSSDKYKSIRSCLNYNHGEEGQALEACAHGDGHYTEEDWADLVSSTIDTEKNNVGCFLVSQNNNTYTELYLDKSEGPHSPSFYRALNVFLMQNDSYPAACEKLIAQESLIPTKNCALKLND